MRDLLQNLGLWGLFIEAFSEALFLPVPPDIFVATAVAMGFPEAIVALITSAGSMTGAMVAHFLGRLLGEKAFLKLFGKEKYEVGVRLFRKYGVAFVLIAAFTPIPFNATSWLTGIFEMNPLAFLLTAIVGRVPRFFMVSYGLSYGIDILKRLKPEVRLAVICVGTVVGLVILAIAWRLMAKWQNQSLSRAANGETKAKER